MICGLKLLVTVICLLPLGHFCGRFAVLDEMWMSQFSVMKAIGFPLILSYGSRGYN